AVEGGHRLAAVDEVELLLAGVHLVVLGDENCARVLRDSVDAEGGDAEVVADRLPGGRPVSLDGRDVVEDGDLPVARARGHRGLLLTGSGSRRGVCPCLVFAVNGRRAPQEADARGDRARLVARLPASPYAAAAGGRRRQPAAAARAA